MRWLVLPLLSFLGFGCSDASSDQARAFALIEGDPVIARALHDPLMSDPDLASRNEANAVIGIGDSAALPVLRATPEDARAAREAGRLELLETGLIPDLPLAVTSAQGKPLGPQASASDLLAALGAPASCAAQLREDFALAASLPPVAVLPPLAMVVQAGGAETGACRVTIIRYTTAAVPEDVLQYHYARARRAGLDATRHSAPEDILVAKGKSQEMLLIHVRPAAHGLSGVDLLYRAP